MNSQNLKKIEVFFTELGKSLAKPCTIYLCGGTASLIYGGARPTQDIDFGIEPLDDSIETALLSTSQSTQTPIQYAKDIERWGMINLPEYQQCSLFWKQFDLVEVRLLSPEVWAIGKLTRYHDSDEQDLCAVFRKQKPELTRCLETWERALESSPRSTAQKLFIQTVNHFLKVHASEIWNEEIKISFPSK